MWAREAALEPARPRWVTPGVQRHLRVPQMRPPRYLAVRDGEDGEEECFGWPCLVKHSPDLPLALGLDIDHQTLLRLVKAGFVRCVRPTPALYLLDLESLHDFLTAVSDSDFWTRERRQRWQETRQSDPWLSTP